MSVETAANGGTADVVEATPAPQTPSRPTLWRLLALAWPIIVTRSAQSVVGFTDAIMVGKLGEDALAATTAGATNSFFFFILPMGTVFIVSSFTSQLAGAGNAQGARRFAVYGLSVAALGGFMCIALIPAMPWLLDRFDYTPAVKALLQVYLSYRLLSGGFAVGLEALGNYYGGLGNTRLPMLAQLLAMVLNVALCFVLIYGHLGFPALGVKGSAIAATVATGVAFFALLLCFLLRIGERVQGPIAIDPHAPALPVDERGSLNVHELFRMLRFGIPAGLNWFIEFSAFWFFMNVVLAGLGTTAVAAVMAVLQLNSISFMPAFAVASAGAIFVGQAIGARRHDDVPYTVRLAALTAGTWQGLVGLVYVAAPAVFMGAFLAKDVDETTFLEVGTRILMLSAAWQVFDAVSMVIAEALRAAGDTAFTFWTRAAIAWGVFAPGAWVCVRVLGMRDVAAVAWLVVYLALLAAVLFWRFRTGRWRTLNLTGAP